MKEERLTAELLDLIGPDAFFRLAEHFGGRRLYVPVEADGQLVKALGRDAAGLLVERYSRAYLRVPLARAHRARQFRSAGMSNAQIARRLGMTETGVDKMFARMDNPPERGGSQLSLFP